MVMLELNELRHDQRIQWETRYHMNQDTLHWITTIVDEEEPTTLVGLLAIVLSSGISSHHLSLDWKSFEALVVREYCEA